MKTDLYPLKFTPKFFEKLWGGTRISELFTTAPEARIGEAWLLSDVPGNETPVANGPLKGQFLQEVIQNFSEELFGKGRGVNFSGRFPLLFKIIDARDDLSVQVHPDDVAAKVKHNSAGKTEMWYILDHDPKATLISGFKHPIDAGQFKTALQNGKALELLNQVPVNKKDCFFIPPGRVHAIGKGTFLAEIQQTSNATYRVYDFDRVDDQGNARELHIKEAAEASNFQDCDSGFIKWNDQKQGFNNVVTCSHFAIDHLAINSDDQYEFNTKDTFFALFVIEGSCKVTTEKAKENLKLYEVLLLPANTGFIKINASEDCQLLVVQ